MSPGGGPVARAWCAAPPPCPLSGRHSSTASSSPSHLIGPGRHWPTDHDRGPCIGPCGVTPPSGAPRLPDLVADPGRCIFFHQPAAPARRPRPRRSAGTRHRRGRPDGSSPEKMPAPPPPDGPRKAGSIAPPALPVPAMVASGPAARLPSMSMARNFQPLRPRQADRHGLKNALRADISCRCPTGLSELGPEGGPNKPRFSAQSASRIDSRRPSSSVRGRPACPVRRQSRPGNRRDRTPLTAGGRTQTPSIERPIALPPPRSRHRSRSAGRLENWHRLAPGRIHLPSAAHQCQSGVSRPPNHIASPSLGFRRDRFRGRPEPEIPSLRPGITDQVRMISARCRWARPQTVFSAPLSGISL